MAGFSLYGAIRRAAALDAAERLQAREIMVFGQSPGGNHRTGSGLVAAMPGLVLPRCGVVWRQPAGTGPGIGKEPGPGWRIAPGTNRRRPLFDRCNRAAIAVLAASAVTTLPQSAIRRGTPSAACSSPPWSAAIVASVRRDHHPDPGALTVGMDLSGFARLWTLSGETDAGLMS